MDDKPIREELIVRLLITPTCFCVWFGTDQIFGAAAGEVCNDYRVSFEREEKHIEREQAANLAVQKEQEEQAAQSFTPYWNFPMIDDDDECTIQYREYLENSSNAITPDLSTKEPGYYLSMGDEHLNTIPETKSDEVIKSSIEDLVPILSESEGIFNMCDVPSCDKKHFDAKYDLMESLLNRDTPIVYSPKIDSLLENFIGELAPINPIPPRIHEADFDPKEDIRLDDQMFYDDTLSDDNSFEDIDYVEASPPDSELVSIEEVEDDILRSKLSNIYLLIAKIESLNDNPTPSSLSHKSLPEFKTFSNHTKETRSGSTSFQCQPMNQNHFEHNSNYFGFDQTPQFSVTHQLPRRSDKDMLLNMARLKFTPYWNFPIIDDDDDEYTIQYREYLERLSKAITPDLPIEEPDNSLSMGDEHLNTIPETESNEVIKSSVKNLVPIPRVRRAPINPIPPGIHEADFDPEEDIRLDDQLFYDDTSSDDDSFEDIDYVKASPPDSELVSLEEVKDLDTKDGEIDTNILLTIKDDILREKLWNINILIAKIESLNDNPTLDFMLKSHSSFPIPVKDSDLFLEKSETFLSLPKLETFRFDIEEKNSGSTTVHADISLSEYDSFHFEIEPDQGELTRVVVEDISDNSSRELYVHVPNVLPTLPTLEDRHYLFLTYVI
ncbi:hypothetical protein Tco_0845587 [Tanacetum coccineum]